VTTRPPLSVVLYGRHVADVIDAGFGDTALRYTDEAMRDPSGARLSLSLPVQTSMHRAVGPGGRWVRSLLPEGRALAWAVQHYGIPEDDRYGLIAELGEDVAGAAQILRPDGQGGDGGRYEALTPDEVSERVTRSREEGLGLDRKRGVRLSLAGMQDKLLLHKVNGEYMLPVHGAASTVIIKPEPPAPTDGSPSLAGLATNELFCLTLARASGLNVATARVETFDVTKAVVVDRYDRRLEGDRVVRTHQEDLLGALGQDPLLKYERAQLQRLAPAGGFAGVAGVTARGGPALLDLAALLAEHLGRARLGPFLDAVTFNIAIGNADAHARNYSLLLRPDGQVELAPLYDLISTRLWDSLDEAAQLIAGRIAIDEVSRQDLIDEACKWDLPPRFATDRIDEILERISGAIDSTIEVTAARGGALPVAEAVGALVRNRLVRLHSH
jgi:serine/threonine-protein kinase HipA